MRVKDFVRMYKGFARIRVEIYPVKRENYLSEEATGFEIVNGVLRIFIRGCE